MGGPRERRPDLSVGSGGTGAEDGSLGDFAQDLDLSVGIGRTGAESDEAAKGLGPGVVLAGRYEILERIGIGGMGAVYRVRDRLRDTEVALKAVLPSLLSKPKALERFRNEAEIMLGLTHEGIVRVHDVGFCEARGLRFFTMELLAGCSLREWLRARQERGGVSPKDALEITRQVLEALRYAHEKTVHRDRRHQVGNPPAVLLGCHGLALRQAVRARGFS